MGTTFATYPDHVFVRIDGKLDVGAWSALRDACSAALSGCLPLRLDVGDCHGVDYGGIGALMSAQQKLGAVEINGCSDRLKDQFKVFGVCGQCSTREPSNAACPNAA